MSALTSLVVADNTPTNHTFVPRDKSKDGVVTFVERGAVALADKLLTAQLQDQPNRFKVRVKLAVPTVVTAVINSVNQSVVDDIDYADVTFTLSKKRTDLERQHFVAQFKNSLNSTVVNIYDMLIKGESSY